MQIIWSYRYDHGLNIGHQIRYYILYFRTIYFSGPFTSFFKSNQWYIIYDIKNIDYILLYSKLLYSKLTAFLYLTSSIEWTLLCIQQCLFALTSQYMAHIICSVHEDARNSMYKMSYPISISSFGGNWNLGCETELQVGCPQCWPLGMLGGIEMVKNYSLF